MSSIYTDQEIYKGVQEKYIYQDKLFAIYEYTNEKEEYKAW